VPACTHDEHGDIIDAIAAGKVEKAVAAMIEHLNHIEAVLDMSTPPAEDDDLEAVLSAM